MVRWPWILGCVLLAVFIIVYVALVWSNWNCFRGEDSLGAAIRNVVLVVASVIALLLAMWRSIIADRQAAAAQAQLALAERESLDARYQKGADMLGSGSVSTRIGGVYALKRLAENRPERFHLQVMELLCAFVRNPPEPKHPHRPLGEDITGALDFIIYRSADAIAIEESTRCTTPRAGPFTDFRDEEGFRVNLKGAILEGANLRSAKLREANLDNVKMVLVFGRDADFSGAQILTCNLTRSSFHGAIFDRATMNDVNMTNTSFQISSFMGAYMKVDLSESDLSGANLTKAYLGSANLKHTSMNDADLSGARLERAPRRPLSTETGEGARYHGFCRVTQHQLDSAMANPDDPPHIEEGTIDIETGKPIVWNHKLCGDRWLEHQKTQGSM